MDPSDRERLIEVNLRFVSWLGKSFPELKDRILSDAAFYPSYGALVREVPTLFWSYVGDRDFAVLTQKSASGESVLDRVVALVRASPPAVVNEILVGFVEGHMFPRPGSPLAREMGAAIGQDLSGLG